jgi:hypothetical protein
MNQIMSTIRITIGIWSKANKNKGLRFTGTSKESVLEPGVGVEPGAAVGLVGF